MFAISAQKQYEAPEMIRNALDLCVAECERLDPAHEHRDYFVVLQIEPYIDSYYIRDVDRHSNKPEIMSRYVFTEGRSWDFRAERVFVDWCVNNPSCIYDATRLDQVYKVFTKRYPEWHLKPYYNQRLRILDHIYNCLSRTGTKELLYKSGLDYLAAHVDEIDEVDLLSTKPSEIFPGINQKTLRALNCAGGAELLNTAMGRECVVYLQKYRSDLFEEALNDAQCRYIRKLLEEQVTPPEICRLFDSARRRLYSMKSQVRFNMFMQKYTGMCKQREQLQRIKSMDPLFACVLPKHPDHDFFKDMRFKELVNFLLAEKEEYDRKIRVSNRRRIYEWQEKDSEYLIRYPQTIMDFCREAVYMQNCLTGYVDPYVYNDTNILFLRKVDEPNTPYITVEISYGILRQAYRRFNRRCSEKERNWIREFCQRHDIETMDEDGHDFLSIGEESDE